jgi:hypothetical protein
MKFQIQPRAAELISKVETLLASEPVTMKVAVEKYPSAHGVYVISD